MGSGGFCHNTHKLDQSPEHRARLVESPLPCRLETEAVGCLFLEILDACRRDELLRTASRKDGGGGGKVKDGFRRVVVDFFQRSFASWS